MAFITNIEQILDNTDKKVLFKLFKTFTDKLVENNKDTGIFTVDDEFPVFSDSDVRKAIKEM